VNFTVEKCARHTSECMQKSEFDQGETHVSASTMRVRDAFSIVNFVFPSCPAIRPIQHELFSTQACVMGIARRTDSARKVVSVQRFHILDLKRVQV